jgi:hypothetical protein
VRRVGRCMFRENDAMTVRRGDLVRVLQVQLASRWTRTTGGICLLSMAWIASRGYWQPSSNTKFYVAACAAVYVGAMLLRFLEEVLFLGSDQSPST